MTLPNSVLQMNAIFISIIIEAIPFVLVGCIITGFLQSFLTADKIKKYMPQNKLFAILMGTFLGFFFPSCECGIIPVVKELIRKGVPNYTAFAFMLAAPIINPVVMFSTFIAFNNSWKFVIYRVVGAVLVSFLVGCWLAYFYKQPILKEALTFANETEQCNVPQTQTFWQKCRHGLEHSIAEFFDTGRYLIVGALLAAAMQTYLKTSALFSFASNKVSGILVMLLFAFIVSLCSEADAFIGASLLSLFGPAPIVAFLVFGPMVDIKNLLMMTKHFRHAFIIRLIALVMVAVFGYALFL